MYEGRMEGETGVTSSEAHLLLSRALVLASRCALGDGLSREEISRSLEDMAYAIRTQNVPEDTSPLVIHMV